MSLNIKNERVHDLARRAAAATGKSQTGAIEEALMRLLDALGDHPALSQRQLRAETIHALLAEIDAELALTKPREILHLEDLYDEQTGLPR